MMIRTIRIRKMIQKGKIRRLQKTKLFAYSVPKANVFNPVSPSFQEKVMEA
jgi:hypothetical protein